MGSSCFSELDKDTRLYDVSKVNFHGLFRYMAPRKRGNAHGRLCYLVWEHTGTESGRVHLVP
jgi:hypothetical protein